MRKLVSAMFIGLLLITQSATAQNGTRYTPQELASRTIYRRAVDAVIWGAPAVTLDMMRQAYFRDAKASYNDIVWWPKGAGWENQSLDVDTSVRYLFIFSDTKDSGPIVLDLPAAEYPRIKAQALLEKADIFFGDAAHMRSDHHAGRTWGASGKTPVVEATGARYGMSLISAITSRGHMRFMTKEKGGVNADVFIEFLKRLMAGSKNKIFLIVDRGPAHRAKKTKDFVASLDGKLRLFYLPPYSPDKNPDELVWKHLKADTVGRAAIANFADFNEKIESSMRSLQRRPEKIRSFFQKDSLRYAA